MNQIKVKPSGPCDSNGMIRHVGIFIAVLFALAVSLAGGPRLHAMEADSTLTATVLCSESGVQMIYIGADGIPARPGTDCTKCPQCLALAGPALTAPEHTLPVRSARRRGVVRARDAIIRTSRRLRPQSRGPPSVTISSPDPACMPAAPKNPRSAAADSTKVNSVSPEMWHRTGRFLKDARR
ncbi:DUF2946 family protein [Defluviimonas sp. SAOS-178_SWC]|uniref:DUF2946 family protein n=1 Tax=Defluviimonas sp. SAOS-178_SWC TaxID=3121287 RepID=UPI003221AC98